MRPLQTHMVRNGRFEISGYLVKDGGLRIVAYDGTTAAEYRRGRWSRPVREAREPPPRGYPRPVFPAVTVVLTKGKCY